MVLPNLSKLISSFLNKSSNLFTWNLFNKTNSNKDPLMIYFGDAKPIKASDFFLAYLSICNPFSGTFVRIPYSNKFCFVLTERAEMLFHICTKSLVTEKIFGLTLLPPLAPQCTLTEYVAKKILDSMSEGLMLDKAYKINGEMNESCFKMKQECKLVWKAETKHLNGREWEICVAENFVRLGLCDARGKIIISSILAQDDPPPQIETKKEVVATVLAHELGHAVAMHFSRNLWNRRFVRTLVLWWCSSSLDVIHFIDLLPVISLLVVLWERFYSRSNDLCSLHPDEDIVLSITYGLEAEADYIGLMLMASAGYNPRVASAFYQTYKRKCGLFSTHYSGDKRAELLNRDKVMKKALQIYEDAKAGNGIKSFV